MTSEKELGLSLVVSHIVVNKYIIFTLIKRLPDCWKWKKRGDKDVGKSCPYLNYLKFLPPVGGCV